MVRKSDFIMVRKDNIKIRTLLVLLLVIIEISSLFLLNKSAMNKPVILDEVVLKKPEKYEKAFAILLQSGNDYVTSNEFPTSGYVYNAIKSGCIDETGQRILINGENIINYDSVHQLVELSTPSTSYCYLYFDELSILDAIKSQNSLVAGLYRYQGTTADNYICFGTTDKATCTGDTDKYMYRIIGVDETNQFKLIKKEALNTKYAWGSVMQTWANSTLKTNLNGSYFLTNTTYVPSGWSGRIAAVDWHYWTGTNANVTAADMANAELGATTINAKIGLMYLHDYYYGLAGGNNCSSSGAYSTCGTSWIYLWQSQNDSNAPDSQYEWTISRYNQSNAWSVRSDGFVSGSTDDDIMMHSISVRPVFYLNTEQVIVSGNGTLADPYILDE